MDNGKLGAFIKVLSKPKVFQDHTSLICTLFLHISPKHSSKGGG